MSEVKNIPRLRFSEFQDKWTFCIVNDIFNVYDGTHQTPKYVSDGIPFVSVENIKEIYSTDKFITNDAFEKEYKIKPRKNDILMTRITAGIIGDTAIVMDYNPLAYYVSLALLRKKTNSNTNFLEQRINTSIFKKELHKRIIHVAFPKKINLGDIKKCSFSFPSLPEQQKIADFLTAVDKRIELLEKKKTLLETYKKGVMKKIFNQEIRFKDDNGNDFPDWKETTLGKLAKITTGDSNRSDSESFGEYMFFDRSVDVRMSSTYSFDTKAIIVAGEGKDFIPRYYNGKFGLHQRTYAIYDFINSDAKFLYYWIYYFRYFFLKTSVGSTMPSLRMNSFTKFPVSKPTKEEQVKISEFFSSIDNQIELLETQIDKSKTWKKGLLQKMFV